MPKKQINVKSHKRKLESGKLTNVKQHKRQINHKVHNSKFILDGLSGEALKVLKEPTKPLNEHTYDELYYIAKNNELKGYSQLNKVKLVEFLEEKLEKEEIIEEPKRQEVDFYKLRDKRYDLFRLIGSRDYDYVFSGVFWDGLTEQERIAFFEFAKEKHPTIKGHYELIHQNLNIMHLEAQIAIISSVESWLGSLENQEKKLLGRYLEDTGKLGLKDEIQTKEYLKWKKME